MTTNDLMIDPDPAQSTLSAGHRYSAESGAAAIAALVAIPILGLAMAALDRQPDPLTGSVSPLFQVSAGVGELLVRSVLLSAFVGLGSGIVGTWLAWVEHRTRMLGAWAIATLLPLAMPRGKSSLHLEVWSFCPPLINPTGFS